jgi:polysaccharide export outer membrane protein
MNIPVPSIVLGTILVGLCGYPATAQSTTATDKVVPYGPSVTQAGQIVLGPGDQIDVQVFETKELSGPLRVDQYGKIELPVGGQLEVAGLTAKEAASAIENRLREAQIMLSPNVSVSVVQYATQGLTVLGEVKAPGVYPLLGPHTLYDALAVAGGPTQLEGGTITITRHNDPDHPVIVNVNGPNYSQIQHSTPVFPGDSVVVSQADLIYAVGDVNSPGAIPIAYGRQLSLLNVLALARGTSTTAALKKAVIIRQSTEGLLLLPIDIKAVMMSKAPNPILQASDVLVVPDSDLKKFLQFALPSLTNIFANAGVTALIDK